MPTSVAIATFLAAATPIWDVRSPGEYTQGHIPGAINHPLFSDAERAQVGTLYKQVGRDAAVELGLQLVGPKLSGWVQIAQSLGADRQVRLHCWRGGLRSSSVAMLLETVGVQVTTLTGGYRSFRRWARTTFATPKPILILGGMTGTGKTAVLAALADRGAAVLDLEAFAHHRGSSYGSLGLPPQPTTEQFENELAIAWAQFPGDQPVWIEAESRWIGLCRVPEELFQQMARAPVLALQRSRAERMALLLADYGSSQRTDLIAATQRLHKRLGGDRTQRAIRSIETGELTTAIDIVLTYYDQTYQYDLQRRGRSVTPVEVTGCSPAQASERVLAIAATLPPTPHHP